MSRLFTLILILACWLSCSSAINDATRSEILVDESNLENFYTEAKDDFNAANVERRLSAKDRLLSNKLQSTIDRTELEKARNFEDAYSDQQRLVSLQLKIRQTEAKQKNLQRELVKLNQNQEGLQKLAAEEKQAYARSAGKVSLDESREHFVQDQKERIESSAKNLVSQIEVADRRIESLDNFGTELKSTIQGIAGKLITEERRSELFEREGILLRRKSAYAAANTQARNERDASMYDFAKALLLSRKASAIRNDLEKLYSDLKISKNREGKSIEILLADRKSLSQKMNEVDGIRQDINALDSDQIAAQTQRQHISEVLDNLNGAFVESNFEIRKVSAQEKRDQVQLSQRNYRNLLKQLDRIKAEETKQAKAMGNDLVLNRRLRRAARLHALSEKRLNQAARDAANSAAKLLEATSILTTVDPQN
jgi:hypothetical protein